MEPMPLDDRVWLDVPYSEKDEAKRLGARWDTAARRWYAPRPRLTDLARWKPLPPIPDQLPGEDRSFGGGLFVDLVPNSCWFTNARSCIAERDWDRVRRMVTTRAGFHCEACGRGEDRTRARPRRLEVHERWDYDQAQLVQALRRLICLCTDCHTTTHYGLAQINGRDQEAFAHLMTVTGTPHGQAEVHVASAFKLWRARSQQDWSLDLGILTNAGIAIRRPPQAGERAREAAQQAMFRRLESGDEDDAAKRRLAAAELVQMIRGQGGIPEDVTGTVSVRLPGGQWVDINASEI